MDKLPDILKTDHARQFAWLENQIKIKNGSSFLNPVISYKAFNELYDLFLDPLKLESFVSRYLSESGTKRLVTTLRVANTRRKNSYLKSLDVKLDPRNFSKLDKISKKTGLTKTELINMMIKNSVFSKKELNTEI